MEPSCDGGYSKVFSHVGGDRDFCNSGNFHGCLLLGIMRESNAWTYVGLFFSQILNKTGPGIITSIWLTEASANQSKSSAKNK